jgi:hypothetical protein
VPAQSPAEKEYEARYRKIDQESTDDLLELATWCRAKGLESKAKTLLLRVTKKDPDNEEARNALGHVKTGERWVTADEARKLEKEGKLEPPAPKPGGSVDAINGEPAAKRVKPPTEAEIRKEVKESIANHKADAAKLRSSYVDEIGVDQEAFNAGRSPHVFLFAKASPTELENLLTISESVYAKLNCLFHGKPEMHTFGTSGSQIIYSIESSAYQESLEFMAKNHGVFQPKEVPRIFKESKDSGGYGGAMPPFKISKDPEVQRTRSLMANEMAHAWTIWNARGALSEGTLGKGRPRGPGEAQQSLITWLAEGMGIWASKEEIGTNLVYRTSKTMYSGDTGKAKKGDDPDSMYLELCYQIATGKAKNPKPFYSLTKTSLNQLDDTDLAVSWSVVDYLITERLDDFRALLKRCSRSNSFRVAFIDVFGDEGHRETRQKVKEDVELDGVFQGACDRFEAQWKEWVKSQVEYKSAYETPGERTKKPRRRFPGDEEEPEEEPKGKGKGKPRRK